MKCCWVYVDCIFCLRGWCLFYVDWCYFWYFSLYGIWIGKRKSWLNWWVFWYLWFGSYFVLYFNGIVFGYFFGGDFWLDCGKRVFLCKVNFVVNFCCIWCDLWVGDEFWVWLMLLICWGVCGWFGEIFCWWVCWGVLWFGCGLCGVVVM